MLSRPYGRADPGPVLNLPGGRAGPGAEVGRLAAQPLYYVYGITAAGPGPDPGTRGIGAPPAPVAALAEGDLQAVVSPAADPAPAPTADNTRAHQQVLAAIMERGAIIPFAFGYVLPEPLVRRLLRSAAGECRRLLALLDGKIEVGLTLIWRPDAFAADIETPELAAARRQAAAARPAPAPPPALQARLGELAQQAVERRRAEYRRLIYEPLAAAAAAAHLGEPAGPRVALAAAFLLERAAEAGFDRQVNELCTPHLDRLDVRYTGPWPPYHFVTLRLRLEEGG